MNDDWRLRVTLREHDHADRLAGGLAATEIEQGVATSLRDRVIVSRDGAELFCYAGARDQLDGAQSLITSLASEHGWDPEFELKRWHPTAEEWEDADAELPDSASGLAAERADRIEHEREHAEAGFTDYEVRVQCASHQDASRLADQLEAEGVPHARRWRYVLVGATDEDSAAALAERLRGEAPEGAEVTVEGTAGAALAGRPANPFAFLGGLAG
jgi:hypothetical protein